MMTAEWQTAAPTDDGLDEAEVAAFTGMVRAFLLYRPTRPVKVFVGWCANDYQIDAGTAEGRAEYHRLIDQAAALGAQYVLYAPSNSALSRREESVDDWSWEHVLWLGLGQKIRKNEWDPRSSPIPPSVQEMVDYARGKRWGCSPTCIPFCPSRGLDCWCRRARSSARARACRIALRPRPSTSWSHPPRTGIAGYAFDHTFLTFEGSSRYAQWWGWRRVMEELRRRVPDIVIDGRQAYHLYGPWSWLAGSYPHPTFNDEQPESFAPYPDLHFDRVSADRERYTAYRYRKYEFAEYRAGIHHASDVTVERSTMPSMTRGPVCALPYRVRDWDRPRLALFAASSIAVGGWNNIITSPRGTLRNESLRSTVRGCTLARLDQAQGSIPQHANDPRPARGREIDARRRSSGTVASSSFQPGRSALTTGATPMRPLVSVERLWCEATQSTEPVSEAGRVRGVGYAVPCIDGGSARVLEIQPATEVSSPMLFNAPGRVVLENGVLDVRDVRGEVGTPATLLVTVPSGVRVSRARVNGVDVPLSPTRGNAAELRVQLDGGVSTTQPATVGDRRSLAARFAVNSV
jgi:hypothetical protein